MDTPKTKKEVEKLAKRIATNAEKKAALQTEYEREVMKINQEIAPKIEKLDEKIKSDVEAVTAWALENPEEFESKKTLELSGVEIAYKDGVPKVVVLEKWDEEKVIASLSEEGKKKYVRVKTSLDKRVILSDYSAEKINDKELKKHGLAVVKEPTVSVKVKNATVAKKG